MSVTRCSAVLCLVAGALWGATFGTLVTPTGGYLVGGAADLVLDEPRGRLYLINTTQNRVELYSVTQRRFLSSIKTDSVPLAADMSRDGRFLYVVCHDSSALSILDLEKNQMVRSVSLPAKPEGVAVGADERVLITTIGTGVNNAANTLLLFDPNAVASTAIGNVQITPPQAMPPQLPPLSGRIYLAGRSRLIATRDGSRIIGLNAPNTNSRTVFVYEVASATVLKSRSLTGISTVLSVAPDGSKFMAGLTLFETSTLTVLAQQNAANAPFPLSLNTTAQGFNQVATQFNTQQNQGGSVFSPDGSYLFTAFNIAPVQNPPARASVSQLYLNDPDNLMILGGLQLPENLAGKMIISSDGGVIYALSDSGFMVLPISTLRQNPIVMPQSTVSLLASDVCGVYAANRVGELPVLNEGRGRMTVTPQLLQSAGLASTPGLGTVIGGPGAGIPGGIFITFPPVPGAGQAGAAIPGLTSQQNQVVQTAPRVRARSTAEGVTIEFEFNPLAGRSPGTVAPHDFLIQSNEAVNIAPSVRVFQNYRESEARSQLVPIPTALSPNEGLADIALDANRRKIYISNSGLNRVEVFDIRSQQFQAPIKVGQLPRSMSLSPDSNLLYVANTGSEYISVIDLEKGEATGRVRFPPIPFNTSLGVIFPNGLAATQRGLQIVMSNGTLWRAIGDEAAPRPSSPLIGTATIPSPRSMTATPNGEYALMLDGQGYAYLYDAMADEYVQRRQVVSAPIRGYYGPVAAGPRGNYFLVNGLVLNQSLTPINSAGTVSISARPGATPVTYDRPVSAVAAAGTTQFARMSPPLLAAANVLATEAPAVELVEVNSGRVLRSTAALEGPLSTLVGTQRINTIGRGMVVEGTTAYVLTTSGLSIVPLDPFDVRDRPTVSRNGAVNLGSYTPTLAPGTLMSIFGTNLGSSATASAPLPSVLGGICATLGSQVLPLLMTSPGQINAQVPVNLAAGRYQLLIRNLEQKAVSAATQVTITKYAPAVLADASGRALVFRRDGSLVTKERPAKRDERLVLYATGLGVTKGGKVVTGDVAPSEPLAVTDPVKVFFGDPRYSQAEIIVEWSGLTPGFVGLYQVNLYVPGDHMRGNDLPVTLRIGNVDSPTTGPVKPVIAVD